MKNFKIRSFINQGIELTSKSTKLELTWTKKKKNTNLGTLVNANVVILFFFFLREQLFIPEVLRVIANTSN